MVDLTLDNWTGFVIVIIVISVVIAIIAARITRNKSKNDDTVAEKLFSPLVILACGVSLILVPQLLLSLLLMFGAPYPPHFLIKLLPITSIAGSITVATVLIILTRRSSGRINSGFKLMAIATVISICAWLLTRLNIYTDSIQNFYSNGGRVYKGEIICIYAVLLADWCSMIMLAIGSFRLMPLLRNAFLIGVCYMLLAFGSIYAHLEGLKSLADYSSIYSLSAEIISIIAGVNIVAGWWFAARASRRNDVTNKEKDSGNGTENRKNDRKETPEVTSNDSKQTSTADNQSPRVAARTRNDKPDEMKLPQNLKDQLIKQTDEQLKAITDNPGLYTNPAYVAEAQRILNKRAAWAIIADKPDNELMDIVLNNDGIYNDDMRDAASMELYSRDSHLLIDAIAGAADDTRLDILARPENYFDGYVMMARKIAEAENNSK